MILPAPLVIVTPVPCVRAALVNPVPFPMSSWPALGVVVSPVPPLATGNAVPLKDTANVPEEVMLAGVTLRKVGTVMPMLVTVPPEPVAAMVIEPAALVMLTPDPAVRVVLTKPEAAVLPMSICPLVGAVVSPVPPLVTGNA